MSRAEQLAYKLLEADSDDVDPRAYLNALPRQNWTYHVEFENIDDPSGEWVVYFELDGVGYGMLAENFASQQEAEKSGKDWVNIFNRLQRENPFPRESKTLSVWNWYMRAKTR